jgi:hypothetical protein
MVVVRWSLMFWCVGRYCRGTLVAGIAGGWPLMPAEIRLRGPGPVWQPAAVQARCLWLG